MDPGLIAYWNFDEGGGSKVADVSGNGNDGTLGGEVEWVEGVQGKALRFKRGEDDLGGFVCCGNKLGLSLDRKDFSITAWMKPEAFSLNCILYQGGCTKGCYLALDGASLYFLLNDALKSVPTDSKPGLIPLERWTHVAAVVKRSQNVDFLINGTPLTEGQYLRHGINKGEKVSDIGDVSSPSSLYIGFGPWPFFGALDEIKIFSRALTTEEVKREYELAKR